ncbi:hypothetical protein FXN61_08290 [Lentzea sp. PSKA42]|uniref:Uncharacterized protein n=1 Tax=Lentzea indica TaxID=2604800 RepID=A0ABX1FD47_9PSEU|nr:hypothetical protein [Lentzea indica]NKE56835.1 hypothetical protein [Lentzea indica]
MVVFGVLDIPAGSLDAVIEIRGCFRPGDAERINGFASREVWERHEPLQDTSSIRSPVGIWCGQEDPFHDAARELANKVGAVGSSEHGAHDDGYWRRVLQEALQFIGIRVAFPSDSKNSRFRWGRYG